MLDYEALEVCSVPVARRHHFFWNGQCGEVLASLAGKMLLLYGKSAILSA